MSELVCLRVEMCTTLKWPWNGEEKFVEAVCVRPCQEQLHNSVSELKEAYTISFQINSLLKSQYF
jgi:hypothetical protein